MDHLGLACSPAVLVAPLNVDFVQSMIAKGLLVKDCTAQVLN